MKLYSPDYYKHFKCISSKCRHNCCIGWEIDIDSKTAQFYENVGGSLGERLKKCISYEGTPHFILGKDERCPFLNENNLCDIICELGDFALCQICRDHPRYRTFFGGREEIGVGLCCEAAAELIIGKADKTVIERIYDDRKNPEILPEETELLKLRDEIFEVLQNRSLSFEDRLRCLSELYGLTGIPDKICDLCKYFLPLEYMEKSWREFLEEMQNNDADATLPKEYDTMLEQISVYFVYRYLVKYLDGEAFSTLVGFCVLCTKMISAMCKHTLLKSGVLSLPDICELSRMFSSEVEYSEENVEALLSYFYEE